jgi:hypothetical protein
MAYTVKNHLGIWSTIKNKIKTQTLFNLRVIAR